MRELVILIYVLCAIGWGRCVYKMASCDWNPIGKAEVIYTAGVFTGLGVVIGYIDIKDK